MAINKSEDIASRVIRKKRKERFKKLCDECTCKIEKISARILLDKSFDHFKRLSYGVTDSFAFMQASMFIYQQVEIGQMTYTGATQEAIKNL